MIEGCIFDLDGVIVDTAKYHFLAWRRLANELGFDFTEADNEHLKGVSRTESLNLILRWGNISLSEKEKEALAARKNDWYREYILKMGPDEILPGFLDFLAELKARGIKVAVGSASKNAPTIVEQIGLADEFVTIIDGNTATRSKPDPQVFCLGARAMAVAPENCIVFEDAIMGIEAAKAGGFVAVGVGEKSVLKAADYVIPGFEQLHFEQLLEALGEQGRLLRENGIKAD